MTQAMALEDTTWTEEAVDTIADLARRKGTVTADDLRQNHRPAPHPNHVGAAFKIARSRGLIAQVGVSTSKQRSRHGGTLRQWEAV
ncbi:hypothetical protein QE394_001141 [Arthrobacter sp. SORGH_AS 212]|uniref:hypothetical protein n=1 Tax=Pseudarthrobacter sp. SORGH_AS 212 TaxID=3041777 RepID=UPI00278B1F82|nr:hypothetical protein [Arthrobacter sp. SORGH_AS_0212]